jgi:hypothetical protein
MSIIQEALVKAQKKNIAGKTAIAKETAAEPRTAEKPVEQKTEQKTQVRSVFYAVLFFAVLALFVSNYFSNNSTKTFTSPEPEEKTYNQFRSAEPVINKETFDNPGIFEFSKNLVLMQGEFTLSGVMNLEDGPRAIINNTTLMEGENIRGAKVVKISTNEVVLKRRDSKIVLHLK